jgi:hypothetical protein
MSFTIRKFYEEPIILGTTLESFDLTIDVYPCLYAMCTQLEAVEEPIYLVGDVHSLKPSFGDILNGFALASQGNVAILQHPNLLELVIISPSDFLNTSLHKIQGIHTGLAKTSVYPTLETGLAYVRSQIAKERSTSQSAKSPNSRHARIKTGKLDLAHWNVPSGEQQVL